MKRGLTILLAALVLLGCACAEEATVPAEEEAAYVPVEGAFSVTMALPEGYICAADFADSTTYVALVCCPGDPGKPVLYLSVIYDANDAYASIDAMPEAEVRDWITTLRNQYMAEYGSVNVRITAAENGKSALVVTGAPGGKPLAEIYYLVSGYQVQAHVTAVDGEGAETALTEEQLAGVLAILSGMNITAAE